MTYAAWKPPCGDEGWTGKEMIDVPPRGNRRSRVSPYPVTPVPLKVVRSRVHTSKTARDLWRIAFMFYYSQMETGKAINLNPCIHKMINHSWHTSGKIKDAWNIVLCKKYSIALFVGYIETEWSHNCAGKVWWHISAPESSPKEPKTWAVVPLDRGTTHYLVPFKLDLPQHVSTTHSKLRVDWCSWWHRHRNVAIIGSWLYAECVKDAAEYLWLYQTRGMPIPCESA